MSSPVGSTLLAAVGIAVFTAALVTVILFVVRRVHAAAIRALEPEGVIRRSGRVRIRLSLSEYRGPKVHRSSSVSIRTGELVLTRKRLVLAMPYLIPLGVPPWDALTVEVREGKVYLMTSEPPEATGKVEVTVQASEPEAWVVALRPAARGKAGKMT